MTDDYYSIPALSSSGINAFYKSPLHFWRESPFNPNRIVRQETPSMIFGSLCHALVLEPETIKPEKFTTKKEKEAYAAAVIMRDALFRNSGVRKLLKEGSPEKPLYWENGISCKAKLDYYRNGLIVDYKTTTSVTPEDFAKSIVNFGYHRQAAWYMEGVEKITGERPVGFVFIVQEKELPDAIGIYSIEPEALEVGKEENEHAISVISERLITGKWSAFPETIKPMQLPAWYKSKAIGEAINERCTNDQ